MAAAFGSFSIREYALKMRTLDVVKSWPFGCQAHEVKKETAEAFLPPITVTKFRWWSDELELVRSNRDEANQEPNLETKIDENKTASEKVDAENMNDSDQEKEKFEKVCPVCRVFAASTVNAVNAHIDGCLALASTEDQWQMKKASSKTKLRVPKKRSIAEIFAVAPPIESIAIAKHENDCLNQGEIVKSKVSKSRGLVSAMETIKGRKKMKKKMKKNRILLENSTPIANKLNKYKKNFNNEGLENIITTKEIAHQINLQDKYDQNRRDLSRSKRHRSEVLDHVTKSSSTQKKHRLVEHGESKSKKKMSVAPCRSVLKNKAKVSLQSTDQEKFHGTKQQEKHVRFLDKEVIIGSESFAASKEKEKTIEGIEEVAPFEARESGEVSTDDHDELPNFLRNSAEKSTSTSNVSMGFSSYRQLIDRLVDPLHPVGKNSMASSLSIPSQSSAFSENGDKRFSNPPISEPKRYASLPGMAGSRQSFQDWQQNTAAGRRNYMDDEFFGLPLNSQGELIHLSSSSTNGFNQPRNLSVYRTANEAHHVQSDLPKHHFNFFPSKMHTPIGVAELESRRRAEIQWLNFENGTNQPVNIAFNECRYTGKVQTQQTMRLMGKDVAVGRSSKQIQGTEDGKFWRNCENMNSEYLPAYTTQYNSSDNRVFHQDQSGHALSETPREALVHQLRFQNNQTLLPPPSSYGFLNNEISLADPRSNIHPVFHSSSATPIFSVTPNIQQPYVSGLGPLMMSSSHNSCQEMYGSTRLVPSKSALGFPFLRPDYRDHVQSPSFQVSNGVPPWMMSQRKEQERTPSSSSGTFRGMSWNNYSHITPSMNHFPRASTSMFHHPQFVPINTLNIKDSADQMKVPKITISKRQDFGAGLMRGRSEGGQKHGFELHSGREGATDTVDLGRIPTIDCPNIDSMARTRPVKLGAGTKHSLKPSQSMDQDNSKPTHSTIPFAGFSVSLPESQKKTKIYSL